MSWQKKGELEKTDEAQMNDLSLLLSQFLKEQWKYDKFSQAMLVVSLFSSPFPLFPSVSLSQQWHICTWTSQGSLLYCQTLAFAQTAWFPSCLLVESFHGVLHPYPDPNWAITVEPAAVLVLYPSAPAMWLREMSWLTPWSRSTRQRWHVLKRERC